MSESLSLFVAFLIAFALGGCMGAGSEDQDDPAINELEKGPSSPIRVADLQAPSRVYDGDTVLFYLDFENTADHAVNETICLMRDGATIVCHDNSFEPGGRWDATEWDHSSYAATGTPLYLDQVPPGTTSTYRILDVEHSVTSVPMPRLGETITGTLVDMTLNHFAETSEEERVYEIDVHYKKTVENAWLTFAYYETNRMWREVTGLEGQTHSYEGTLRVPQDWWASQPPDHVEALFIMAFVVKDGESGSSPEKGDFRWRIE